MPENGKKLSHALYSRLLGEKPGEGAKAFLGHLSWITVSFILAKLISSLVNIAAGRALGPREYGQINVMVSAGTAISIFLLAGLNYSLIRYGTKSAEQDRVFTTAAAVFAGLALAAAALTVLAGGAISSFLGISPGMLFFSTAYAIGMSAFQLVSSVQQSMGIFSKRGASEIAFSVLLAACFFGGLSLFGRSYKVMAWAYIAAFSSLAIFWLFRIGSGIKPGFLSWKRSREMLEYGIYYFGSSLGVFLIMNVQSLIVNSFLTPSEVGIYAAHSAASIGISGYLGYAIATVLFPKASASTNRTRLWDMGARLWAYSAPAVILFFVAAQAGVLSLMGREQYGMNLPLMFLFACCAALMLAYNSMAQIIFSGSVASSRLAMLISLCSGAMNFAACLVLVPRFRLAGAVGATIATYVLMLAWVWKAREPHLR